MESFLKQLQQGDIIMYHSHSFISNIIRDFDSTIYNHCAIYDKDGYLYESIKSGVLRKKIDQSLKDQKTSLVTAFRVKNIDKENTECLIDTIKKYPKKKFAYSQFLLIFYVLWKRKLKLPNVFNTILNLFFLLFEKIISVLIDSTENKNMVCSEFVYLTYLHTAQKNNNRNFILHLPLECSTIFFLQNLKTQKLIPCNLEKYDQNNIDLAKNYLSTNLNKKTQSKTFEFNSNRYFLESLIKYDTKSKPYGEKLKKAKRIIKKMRFYNLITPGDIVRSLDTYPVATFKTERALQNINCKICNI